MAELVAGSVFSTAAGQSTKTGPPSAAVAESIPAASLRRRPPSSGGTPAWRRSNAGLLFIAPALVLFLGFIAFPLVRNFQVSFYDWDGLTQDKPYVGLDHYTWAYRARPARLAARNWLLFSVLTIPFQMFIGLLLAVTLRGAGVLRTTLRTLFFLPVVLTPVAVGFLWADIFQPTDGLLNEGLRLVGLDGYTQSWLGDTSTALASVALVNIWMWTGFSMTIYQAALEVVSAEVLEAARMDGATSGKLLWHVLSPMLRPAHYSLLILGVIGSLKSFDLVYVLTRGGPDYASELPTTLLFGLGFRTFEQGKAAAIGTIIFAAALILTLVQLFLYRRKEA